ncbi:MAG: hypothetical protein A2Z32_06410 [Chloroflexi bacterium RBG_16_69_14]|nr:MAG: hypothetical protein A2Z32_06410 [Chloroflexi bacterium RBG_16_69_14]
MLDWLGLMHRQHTVHSMLELDVTLARQAIRERRASTGEALSFTAYVTSCFARAIGEDPRMHALRRGGDELVLFDDVDLTVLVESDVEDAKIPMPHIVRSANTKSAATITREIRAAQAGDVPYARTRRWLPLWLRVPGFLREFVWARVLADPWRRKRLTGTGVVTAVGMFGPGVGWAIPLTIYPISLTVGGISRRPRVITEGADPQHRGERIEPRDCLSLTLSFDHDVIDGAPAARFAARLTKLIESAAGLEQG